MEMTGCRMLPCISGWTTFSNKKSYGPRNSQILVFERFSNFSQKHLLKCDFGSIQWMGYVKLLCIRDYAQFLTQTVMALGKFKFLPFFNLRLGRVVAKLPFQIRDFGFMRNFKLCEFFPQVSTFFLHRKLWFSKMSNFWLVDKRVVFDKSQKNSKILLSKTTLPIRRSKITLPILSRSIEKRGFGYLLCSSGHVPVFFLITTLSNLR